MVDTGADLVVDINGSLQRVQVKSSISTDHRVIFHLGRRNPNRGAGESSWLQYDDGAVDWYALCCIGYGYTALLPAGATCKTITFPGSKELEIGAVIDKLLEENK
jgi:hypothetical protein